MKKLKQNILKTVIGMTCIWLPATKAYSQTIEPGGTAEDIVVSFGGAYTLPKQNNAYCIGGCIGGGIMLEHRIKNTNFNLCGVFMTNGGVIYQNQETNKYKCNIGFSIKVGGGYGRVSALIVKDSNLQIAAKRNLQLTSAYGCGLRVKTGKYINVYADFLFLGQSIIRVDTPNNVESQNYTVRAGLMYTLSRKER